MELTKPVTKVGFWVLLNNLDKPDRFSLSRNGVDACRVLIINGVIINHHMHVRGSFYNLKQCYNPFSKVVPTTIP